MICAVIQKVSCAQFDFKGRDLCVANTLDSGFNYVNIAKGTTDPGVDCFDQ